MASLAVPRAVCPRTLYTICWRNTLIISESSYGKNRFKIWTLKLPLKQFLCKENCPNSYYPLIKTPKTRRVLPHLHLSTYNNQFHDDTLGEFAYFRIRVNNIDGVISFVFFRLQAPDGAWTCRCTKGLSTLWASPVGPVLHGAWPSMESSRPANRASMHW